jgi:hypothetical protein
MCQPIKFNLILSMNRFFAVLFFACISSVSSAQDTLSLARAIQTGLQNNFDVQKLSAKMGALNLMHQYVRESNIKNREAVIGALASYLKGINTDGKREFISEFSGIEFLKGAIKDGKNELRLSKKLLLLLQDLVQNDSLILHGASPSYIR